MSPLRRLNPPSRDVLHDMTNSGRSAARLARLLREQEAEGSNPSAPTKVKPLIIMIKGFSFLFKLLKNMLSVL